MSLADRVEVQPQIAGDLRVGRPVVALESTLISHGLPWPQNLEVARAAEAAVREAGAVPATIAIHAGRIHVGLSDSQIEALARAEGVLKAARPTIAVALGLRGWAATTVSATMIAAHAVGITVFATGGIGGVHRGAVGGPTATFDISSDLEELARTPMAVVCAGPKAILDVPATIEMLETRGVPVVSVGSQQIAGFYARSSGLAAATMVPDAAAAARLARTHLGLGLGSAILFCVPVPAGAALAEKVMNDAIEASIDQAGKAGIAGAALTPWLLARVAELTQGASLRANRALIVNNASTAGALAVAFADVASA